MGLKYSDEEGNTLHGFSQVDLDQNNKLLEKLVKR